LRVFVCEFVTGGGLSGKPLPPSLAREGAMMRDALTRDLATLPGFCLDVVVTRDERSPPSPYASNYSAEGDDVWDLWSSIARDCEAAWPIAPETGGLLARLTATLRTAGTHVIGSDEKAIAIASSKRSTAERLRASDVPTPPVWRAGEAPAWGAGPFVVKPDDGAGCAETRLVERIPDDVPAGHVVQPYIAGQPASLTVLRDGARTHLLAVNLQHVAVEDGAFRYRGVTVGAFDDADGRLAALAAAVGDAIPGLDGLFGIDLVLGAEGAVVVEVNPRLTTAYCGLAESIGFNPLVLVPPFDVRDAEPRPRRHPVEVAA
jgi:predicted ATP-grasp superfamily ATP-dependent carboligase